MRTVRWTAAQWGQMSAAGQPRGIRPPRPMSASLIGHSRSSAFRLSAGYGVDVTHGLVLLFGIGTKALPSWDSRTRWNNLFRDLAVSTLRRVQADMRSHLIIVPRRTSFTSFHQSVDLEFPPIEFDAARYSCHYGVPGPSELSAVPDAVEDHGRPTRQSDVRLFIPRRRAICIAQALSQDHFFERSML